MQEKRKCPECGSNMERVENCYEWHGEGCKPDCDPNIDCIDCDDQIRWFCNKCAHSI